MSSTFLQIRGMSKHFNGVIALSDFDCTMNKNEILGLIGPNGAGKTTFFNIMTGFIKADECSQFEFKSKWIGDLKPYQICHLGISRTFQDLRLIRQLSVLENVQLSFQKQPGEMLSNVFFRRKYCIDAEEVNKKRAIDLLKVTGLVSKINSKANDLSYGQQKLLSLTCCLATGADLVLLDEPVAGIAPELINQILAIILALPEKGKSVMIIEHNIDAIMEVCDRVIFMDSGKKICEGKPMEVREDPKVIEAYLV